VKVFEDSTGGGRLPAPRAPTVEKKQKVNSIEMYSDSTTVDMHIRANRTRPRGSILVREKNGKEYTCHHKPRSEKFKTEETSYIGKSQASLQTRRGIPTVRSVSKSSLNSAVAAKKLRVPGGFEKPKKTSKKKEKNLDRMFLAKSQDNEAISHGSGRRFGRTTKLI